MSNKYQSNGKKLLKACVESVVKNTADEQEPATGKVCEGPQPATKEDCIRKAAEKGQSSVSVFALSKSLLGKRTAESVDNGPKAIFVIISLFDPKENTEYAVAALMGGDLYPLREVLKKCPNEECTVNGEVMPMVTDCLKAKYISRDLMSLIFRGIPADCKDFMKFLAAHFEQAWMLYAPYRGDDKFNGVPAVDTGVQLYQYAKAMQRALAGQPLHYDKVEVVNYFVGIDELRVVDNMYTTQDPHFGRRRSTFTINR